MYTHLFQSLKKEFMQTSNRGHDISQCLESQEAEAHILLIRAACIVCTRVGGRFQLDDGELQQQHDDFLATLIRQLSLQ